MIRKLPVTLSDLFQREGIGGLERLPGIGQSLAASIAELLETGRLTRRERLRGEVQKACALTSMPGIGPEMAVRIRETLGIETLEDLEAAAYDGRLESVPGVGRKRIQAIRDTLSVRLRRGPEQVRLRAERPADEPPVSELLDVDRKYRWQAPWRQTPQVAPRRYNPTHAAWRGVLRISLGSRRYRALFTNTARSHELGSFDDWVIIQREDSGGHGQWTVITAQYGPLRGRRIVRGREAECREYYRELRTQRMLALSAG
jgi:Holliday junction resolvasome RuvABC DNA-binding subunit